MAWQPARPAGSQPGHPWASPALTLRFVALPLPLPQSIPERVSRRRLTRLTSSVHADCTRACVRLPPARWHLRIGLSRRRVELAAAPAHIAGLVAGLGLPTALEKRVEAVVAPETAVLGEDIGRRPARHEAALRLVAQHRDELGAIVGLAAQRLVRNDDRRSRQWCRRDASQHLSPRGVVSAP